MKKHKKIPKGCKCPPEQWVGRIPEPCDNLRALGGICKCGHNEECHEPKD